MKRFIPLVFILMGVLLLAAPTVMARTPSLSEDAVRVISISALGEERINAIVFTLDGRQLIAGASSGIYFFNADTLSKDAYIPTGQWARSLAIQPGGGILAAGIFDQTARTWSLPNAQPLRVFEGHEGWVRSVAFTPDGGSLITVADDDTVRIWEVGTGSLLSTIENLTGARVLAVSPDGEMLAVGLQNKTIELRRLPDGELLQTLSGHNDWVRSLAFSPDGQKLASGAFDATACLWDVPSGTLEHTLLGHQSSVLGVAFSPDGKTLATGSVDRTVRLWDVMTGAPAKVLVGHINFVYSVAFSPDGRVVASGAGDNTIRLWNVASTPDMSDQVRTTPSDCRVCHHPMSTESHPAVVEVRCEACHVDGIGLNWCPYFARSLKQVSNPVPYTNKPVSQLSGVPVPDDTLSVTIFNPANGETLYTHFEYVAPVVLEGRVESLNYPVTEINVSLEIWNGSERISTLETQPTEGGTFAFRLGVNPAGHMLIENDPAAPLSCHACHDDFNVQSYLPYGDARLVVLATSPDGTQVRDERWVVSDASRTASVPVKVVDASSGEPIQGLFIQSYSQLYEWRGRNATATSSADGTAILTVEALSEAPTRFEIGVPPQVVDGVFYKAQENASILIEPGAISGTSVTLMVDAQTGKIEGSLEGDIDSIPAGITVWAFSQPVGPIFGTETKSDGSFSFTDLPVSDYVLFPDPEMMRSLKLTTQPQNVDLTESPSSTLVIKSNPVDGSTVQGVVAGDENGWLPFVWLVGTYGKTYQVELNSGEWSIQNMETDGSTWTASAPGYYSREINISKGNMTDALSIKLERRPDTTVILWGQGEIIIPSETMAQASGGNITFVSGWVWGDNPGSESVTLETQEASIRVDGGRFAVQRLPGGTAWFHLFEGGAEVRSNRNDTTLMLLPGDVVALSEKNDMQPITYRDGMVQIIEGIGSSPLSPVWKPTLAERIGSKMEEFGVGSAQIITFITYIITLLSLVGFLLFLLKWLFKQRERNGANK
ncbi:MAG: WD40 repeat domain-containing protein [Chloroflexota bacterium]